MNKLAARLLLYTGMLCLAPFVWAQSNNDLVRVEVRVASDSDRKDIKGTSADTVTQNKTLARIFHRPSKKLAKSWR